MKWLGILTAWCTRLGHATQKNFGLELFSGLKLMHSRGYISKINFQEEKIKSIQSEKSGQVET